MYCCQSAILPLAFGVWVESTFSEVDVHVKGSVLLHCLWDVHLLIVLVTTVPTLPRGPVSVDQVPVEPEQGLCVVEVCEHLVLGHVHVQVLQAW